MPADAAVNTAQLENDPPERFVRLRDQLGVGSFGINQIVLAPGERNRIHRHMHQEEVYLVMAGTLTLVLEGEATEHVTGALVRVGPQARRQLVNGHRVPLSLLALGGFIDHEHGPRDGEAFNDWSDVEAGTPQTVPEPGNLPASELR